MLFLAHERLDALLLFQVPFFLLLQLLFLDLCLLVLEELFDQLLVALLAIQARLSLDEELLLLARRVVTLEQLSLEVRPYCRRHILQIEMLRVIRIKLSSALVHVASFLVVQLLARKHGGFDPLFKLPDRCLLLLLLGLAGEDLPGALAFIGNWVAISELVEDPVELFHGFRGGIIRSVTSCALVAQSAHVTRDCLAVWLDDVYRLYLELFMRFGWRDWRLYRFHLLAYRGLRCVSRHQRSRFRIERIAFLRRLLLPPV